MYLFGSTVILICWRFYPTGQAQATSTVWRLGARAYQWQALLACLPELDPRAMGVSTARDLGRSTSLGAPIPASACQWRRLPESSRPMSALKAPGDLPVRPDSYWRCFLVLLYSMGLRLREATSLVWRDVAFEAEHVHVTRKDAGEWVQAWQPRDHEEGPVPLPEQAASLLPAWQSIAPEGCPYVFMVLERWAFHRLAGHGDITTTQRDYLRVRDVDIDRAQQIQSELLGGVRAADVTDPLGPESGSSLWPKRNVGVVTCCKTTL